MSAYSMEFKGRLFYCLEGSELFLRFFEVKKKG